MFGTLSPLIHVHSLVITLYFQRSLKQTPAPKEVPPNNHRFPKLSVHVHAVSQRAPGVFAGDDIPFVPWLGNAPAIVSPCIHVHSLVSGSYFQRRLKTLFAPLYPPYIHKFPDRSVHVAAPKPFPPGVFEGAAIPFDPYTAG